MSAMRYRTSLSYGLKKMRRHGFDEVPGLRIQELAELIPHDYNGGGISPAEACLERRLGTDGIGRGRIKREPLPRWSHRDTPPGLRGEPSPATFATGGCGNWLGN